MKRTFKVTVTRITDVIVEIDTDSFDEAAMAEFRKFFYDFHGYDEHARHIAQYAVRFDSPGFLEGYGPVKYDGAVHHWIDANTRAEATYNINIKVKNEEVDTDCEEFKS